MSPAQFAIAWLLAILTTVSVYYIVVTGKLYCAALFIGHLCRVLKEEIVRPLHIIRKALSRKEIELDEAEESISR